MGAPQYEVDSDPLMFVAPQSKTVLFIRLQWPLVFEGPVELFSPFSSPSVLGAPRMTAWLAEEQGITVGTGFGRNSVAAFCYELPGSSAERQR
jgi:hypothetical protein